VLIDLMQFFYEPKLLAELPSLSPPSKTIVSDMKDLYLKASTAKDSKSASEAFMCDFVFRFDLSKLSTSSSTSSGASPISPDGSPRSASPARSPRHTLSTSPSMPVLASNESSSSHTEQKSGMVRVSSFSHLSTLDSIEIYAHKFVLASRSRFFEAYVPRPDPPQPDLPLPVRFLTSPPSDYFVLT
jgi:hypothetical protein